MVQFPVEAGDYILADRGYSTGQGIAHVVAAGGQVTVRVNTHSLLLRTAQGQPFDLMAAGTSHEACRGRPIVVGPGGGPRRPHGAGSGLRDPKRRKKPSRWHRLKSGARPCERGSSPSANPQGARYVILFTTFPESAFTASEVLQWYRVRWQVELIFKRFKSLAQLGHLSVSGICRFPPSARAAARHERRRRAPLSLRSGYFE